MWSLAGALLLGVGGLFVYKRSSRQYSPANLIAESPVRRASNVGVPSGAELDLWLSHGTVLTNSLNETKEGVTEALLKRVYQLYLPVYYWAKQMHEEAPSGRATIIGMQCLQGGGKTTICDQLKRLFQRDGLTCIVASIDDFYRTRAELSALAKANPDQHLLQGRGQPGTHDMALMADKLDELRTLKPGQTMKVPCYDKGAHGGLGDRAPESAWQSVEGPVDVIILEGWCFGFKAVGPTGQAQLRLIDEYLAAFDTIYAQLDAFFVMQALRAKFVYEWREQAEQGRRSRGEGAMSAEQVVRFVDRYFPSYVQYLSALYQQSPCPESKTLRCWIDGTRSPVEPPAPGHDVFGA